MGDIYNSVKIEEEKNNEIQKIHNLNLNIINEIRLKNEIKEIGKIIIKYNYCYALHDNSFIIYRINWWLWINYFYFLNELNLMMIINY